MLFDCKIRNIELTLQILSAVGQLIVGQLIVGQLMKRQLIDMLASHASHVLGTIKPLILTHYWSHQWKVPL